MDDFVEGDDSGMGIDCANCEHLANVRKLLSSKQSLNSEEGVFASCSVRQTIQQVKIHCSLYRQDQAASQDSLNRGLLMMRYSTELAVDSLLVCEMEARGEVSSGAAPKVDPTMLRRQLLLRDYSTLVAVGVGELRYQDSD